MVSRRPTLVDQVRETLLGELTDGTFAVGDQLPNEQEMCERHGVSRATLREAYGALIDMGYLARRRGSGTFVARTPTRHALEATLSYTSMIADAGYKPGVRVIGSHVRPVEGDEGERLRVPKDADVLVIERVRTADDKPVVYSYDRIPVELLPPEAIQDPGGSLFALLEGLKLGPRTGRARLAPVIAEEPATTMLEVAEGVPLLYIEETDYDGHGLPVLLCSEWHVSDIFELWLNRKMHPSSGKDD